LISITLPVGWNIEQGEENTVTAMALDSSAMIVVTTTNTLVPLEKDFFTQFINDYEAYYALKFQGYAEIGRNVDAAAGKGNVTKNVRLGNKEYVFKTDYSRDGAILQSVNFLTLKPYAEAYIPLYQKIFASLKTNRENALKQMPYMETDKADDPAGKFSFSYPLGWYYAPMDLENATGSTYVAPDGSMVLMIMAIPVTPGVAVTDELAKLFVSGFLKGYAADFVATGETKTAAGDLRVTFEAPSKNNKGVVIASNLGERVGLLLITYPADRANETSQLVEKLAGSYTKK
jgi:hypothetical protein